MIGRGSGRRVSDIRRYLRGLIATGTRAGVLSALGMAMVTAPAAGQDVKMQRTPIERELGIISPETAPARSRPADADYYPSTGGIIQEPAFFEALSAKTETGRYGLAGWSSPNSPAGADYREINGWLSFGFAFTWASPPTASKKPNGR